MIRNERQYRITARQRQLLSDALAGLLEESGRQPAGNQEQLKFDLQLASIVGQLSELEAELHDYEALKAGQVGTVRVSSFADLPDALVRARIASGLTQRELGDRLGIKEQQIQRYEAEGYAGVSLSRLQEIMRVLDIDLEAGLTIPEGDTPIARLRRRLTGLGLDRRVIQTRFLRDAPENPAPTKVLELAERAARLLSLPMQQLLDDSAPLPALATTARFKAAKNAAEVPLDAYTRYAESIADIVLTAFQEHASANLPRTAREARMAIEERVSMSQNTPAALTRSSALFNATLQYLWDLNIPVVPLRDPGAFHGACFTRDGRSVIVLKQLNDSYARWLNDLLHELSHVRDVERGDQRSWVELGEISEWSEAPEEQAANDFAADVLFSGRADPVIDQCFLAAGGSVERLKTVVPAVAQQAEVPVDVLANYVAFRLSRQGINWWASAGNLQERDTPWRSAADMLLGRLDLRALDTTDRSSLIDALAV